MARWFTALVLFAGLACASTIRDTRDRFQVRVEVKNYNWSNAIIYAGNEYGGSDYRIGSVGSLRNATLIIRSPPASGFTLAVRLLGSSHGWRSQNLFWVQPGDCVELDVASAVNMTTVIHCLER